MLEPHSPSVSIRRQCALLALPRASLYYRPRKVDNDDLDLMRHLTIDRPNQVFATDITYIPMAHGFLYLVAIMDWHSRKVLSWRLSNTLDTAFCLEALNEAIERYGAPRIVNTDQGVQFTSTAFTDVLKAHNIRISMDGKGSYRDNIFIERLWRTVKYECVYLHAFDDGRDARRKLAGYFDWYNRQRPHQAGLPHSRSDLLQPNQPQYGCLTTTHYTPQTELNTSTLWSK